MCNFTKEDLIEIFKDNRYKLFKVPTKSLDWLFSYDIIPMSDLVSIDDFIKNNLNTDKYNRCNKYIAVRGAGDMFTYGKDIVPVEISTTYCPKVTVNKVSREQYFYTSAHFTTIDDALYSVSLNVDNKQDYVNAIARLKNFLYEYPQMPDREEFMKYWVDVPKCTVDFN